MSSKDRVPPPAGDLADDERRALDAWTAPDPPAGFAARAVAAAHAARRRTGAALPPPRRRLRWSALMSAAAGAALMAGYVGLVGLQIAGPESVASSSGGGVGSSPLGGAAMSIYLACLVFGGIMVLASILGGHGAGDHDVGGGHEVGGHAAGGGDHDQGHAGPAHTGLLPFLSLRFWIFSLTFFGLTGSLLTGLHAGSPVLTPLLAGGVGLGTGYAAARVLQTLARETVGAVPPASANVGREGTLLLPVSRGQRGKIRMQVGGAATDLVAEYEGDGEIPIGDKVLVVGMREAVALVDRSPTPSVTSTLREGEKEES